MAADPIAAIRAGLGVTLPGSSDFDLSPEVSGLDPAKLRPAGVLVALIGDEASLRVVLTKRSSALKHHPGQIALPGGKVDPGDADAVAAALREAEEEIALPRAHVDVLGLLPPHQTVTGFSVSPVIARVTREVRFRAEPGEVDEVFSVPLAHLTDLARYGVQSRRWRGQMRRYYTVPFGPYYIWGATARILHGLAERLKQ